MNIYVYNFFLSSDHKIKLFVLASIVAALEFFGIALIYPLVSIIFDLDIDKNSPINFLKEFLIKIGLPISDGYLIFYLVVIFLSKSLLLLAYKYISTKSVMTMMINLRKNLFKSIFNSDFGYVSDNLNRIINSLTIQSSYAGSTLELIYRIFQLSILLIGLIAIGILISWKMFMFAIFSGFLCFSALTFSISIAKNSGEKLATFNEDYYGKVNQILKNYRYIKSIEISKLFFIKIKFLLSQIKFEQIKYVMLNRGTQIITEPVVLVLILSVLYFGLNFLNISKANIIVVYVILGRFFTSVLNLIHILQQFRKESVSLEYCYKLLDEMNYKKQNINSLKLESYNTQINLKNVSFGYEENIVLKDINFKFFSNELVVIHGKSGTGKSSILNLIIGLIEPTKGSITIGGKNLNLIDFSHYRSKIGLVTQDSVLFNLSVRDNLSLRSKDVEESRLKSYIKMLGLESIFPNRIIDLDYMINQDNSNLSGGEKQRLALIREIVSNPDILILDEFTSALDDVNIERIIEFLESIRNKILIIIVTHQKQYLQIADRLIEMKESINLNHSK